MASLSAGSLHLLTHTIAAKRLCGVVDQSTTNYRLSGLRDFGRRKWIADYRDARGGMEVVVKQMLGHGVDTKVEKAQLSRYQIRYEARDW